MISVRALILGLIAFFALAFFYLRSPYLYDSDSYLHMAVARLYAAEGVVNTLPWARFSVMHAGYGDKELLFHIALVPFMKLIDPATGGRIALAAFGALLIGVIAYISARRIGWAGLLVPLWLLVVAPPWLNRIIRLRPELLALAILLIAAELMARRRPVWIGVAAALFTLSYTAFHVFIGIVAIWTVALGVLVREWDARPLAAAAGGTAAGLILHPFPLDHLRIWFLQNVVFFRFKDRLDVGEEIFPPVWHEIVLVNGAWWAAVLCALGVVAWKRAAAFRQRDVIIYGVCGVIFLALYLAMARMVIYLVPFVTIAAIAAARGVEWPRRTRAIIATIAAAALIPGAMFSSRIDFLSSTFGGRASDIEAHLERLGTHLPAGARVAASWSDAALFSFWAPQGRYLNLYDPLFMAVPYPQKYAAQRALFEGAVIDVPPVMARTLDSDYLAVVRGSERMRLLRLLDGDPRWRVRYAGDVLLLQLTKPASARFLLDWMVLGGDAGVQRYHVPEDLRDIAGFVQLARVAPGGGCRKFVATDPCVGCRLRIRALGETKVSIDGEVTLALSSPREISGWREVERKPSSSLAVELCGPPYGGFFLLAGPGLNSDKDKGRIAAGGRL